METKTGNWKMETELLKTELETNENITCCTPSKINVLLPFIPRHPAKTFSTASFLVTYFASLASFPGFCLPIITI